MGTMEMRWNRRFIVRIDWFPEILRLIRQVAVRVDPGNILVTVAAMAVVTQMETRTNSPVCVLKKSRIYKKKNRKREIKSNVIHEKWQKFSANSGEKREKIVKKKKSGQTWRCVELFVTEPHKLGVRER